MHCYMCRKCDIFYIKPSPERSKCQSIKLIEIWYSITFRTFFRVEKKKKTCVSLLRLVSGKNTVNAIYINYYYLNACVRAYVRALRAFLPLACLLVFLLVCHLACLSTCLFARLFTRSPARLLA